MESFAIGSLAAWCHRPTHPPRARLLLIHGLHEHSGRHLNTVNALVSAGIEVVRFDLRGSGQSDGRRQWVDSFEDYVTDANEALNWCLAQPTPLPQWVLGHSMGGAVAVRLAAQRNSDLHGLVLSAPARLTGGDISPVKILVGKKLAKWFPKFRLKESDGSGVSRDPQVVRAFESDPLCCHFTTLRLGTEILAAMDRLLSYAPQITCPTLIVHGSADSIVLLEGSHQILSHLGSKDKYLHVIPGGYHEPHNDLDKETYFQTLSEWILKHLPA